MIRFANILRKDFLFKVLKRWRIAFFITALSALSGLTLLPHFQNFKFIYGVEQTALSLRFLLRGAEEIKHDATKIVLVAVDDASLFPILSEEDLHKNPEAEILQQPWPWNRSIYGFVSSRLIDAGAKVVAFDFIFPTPNEGDWDFYEAIEAHPGRIVIGYDYTFSENEIGETLVQERLPYDDLLPLDESKLIGFVNVIKDDDGALRRAKIASNVYAENLPFIDDPISYQRIKERSNRSEKRLSLGAQTAVLAEPSVQNLIIQNPKFPFINYGGQNFFPTVSFIDVVLNDRFQKQQAIFEDAIVIVGPYSDFFKDVIPTPWGDMYGIETHAHVARSLLNDSFYKQLSTGQIIANTLTMSALLILGLVILKSAIRKATWIICLLTGYFTLTQLAFLYTNLIFPSVSVVTIVAIGGLVLLVFDFTLSQYERLRLKGYLSRYVSPEITKLVAEDSSELEALLKGANRPIAVMFSDIRGFTTISEAYSPERLVDHLNEYFENMVDSIHQHNGSLNKYIGDAILAFWGGIYSAGKQQDCVNAVKTAIDMCERMETLNAEWANLPGRIPFKIGIGLSYGTAFVGNLGHSKRMEFAVMGDVVNLGSRLEGATKQYGCSILVSEEVYQNCQHVIHFQEIDCIQVKGKTKAVHVYHPLGVSGDPEPNWLNDWKLALITYRSREFKSAFKLFKALAQRDPALTIPAELYMERCTELERKPPPDDWNYVYIMSQK